MSGEGTGVVIGGIVLIAAMPVVLAAGAVAAAGFGAVKIGQIVVKSVKKHHEKKLLEINNCSTELSELYARLNAVISTQDRLSDEYFEHLQGQMEQLQSTAQQAIANSGSASVAFAEQTLSTMRTQVTQSLGSQREAELVRIRQQTQDEMSRIIKDINTAQQRRVAAADWSQKTRAAQAQQQALARDLLRDAQASLHLLQSMAAAGGDPAFAAKVNALSSSLQTAQRSLDAGLTQAAATGAQQVITRSATLVLEYEQERSERDSARTAVIARLEGLKSELEAAQWMEFDDECFGHIEEHLDDFTQGACSRAIEYIDGQLRAISGKEGMRLTANELDAKLDEVENELVPQVDAVVRTGHTMLQKYYERLHVLKILEDHMAQQGYYCDWKQMAGGDATQKAVAHFTEPTTGNSIAIALDDDDPSFVDLNKTAMQVMFYFANGNTITELQKKEIRAGMVDAIRDYGMGGSLACSGSVGTESHDQTMRSQSTVEQLPVRTIEV